MLLVFAWTPRLFERELLSAIFGEMEEQTIFFSIFLVTLGFAQTHKDSALDPRRGSTPLDSHSAIELASFPYFFRVEGF